MSTSPSSRIPHSPFRIPEGSRPETVEPFTGTHTQGDREMRCEVFCLTTLLVLLSMRLMADSGPEQAVSDCRIDAVPAGYYLNTYDDCGMIDRQPHVDMTDCYNFTFGTWDNDADPISRSAVFSYGLIRINYD